MTITAGEEINVTPRKHLLSPDFESYKLQTSDPDDDKDDYAQLVYRLPGTALSPNSMEGKEPEGQSLSYKRLKEKFFHRYLRPGRLSKKEIKRGAGMAYIDVNGLVVFISSAGVSAHLSPSSDTSTILMLTFTRTAQSESFISSEQACISPHSQALY
jgi:hypothetical protein